MSIYGQSAKHEGHELNWKKEVWTKKTVWED